MALTSSLQPHLQVPRAADLPRYLAYATRTLGPVLALAVNSPFLPADLYAEAGLDAGAVLGGPHECRIPVFESTVNAGVDPGNVRVPRDVSSLDEAVERIVADPVYVPFLTPPDERGAAYDARVPEFTHKRSTHWRWVRPVLGGRTPRGDDGPEPGNDDGSVRVEYRPLPTQPSVRDTVGFQALVAGLLRGLDDADHPLRDLPWEAARDAFYAAADEGLDADLAWVTADGTHTDDSGAIFAEVFALARRGLRVHGLDDDAIDRYLGPIEARREAGETPSTWKRERVRERLDAGASVAEAVTGAHRDYLQCALTDRPFVEWL
jgi:hypothetical protein